MADENPTAERWLPVSGFEGYYEVSDLGRVRSLDRILRDGRDGARLFGRVLSPGPTRDGYLSLVLQVDGRTASLLVHRLVLTAFDRPPLPGEECNHKNFDKADNRAANLEWGSHTHNMVHLAVSGRKIVPRGEGHASSKVSTLDVVEIRRRAAAGESQASLAAAFGLCSANISMIVSRKTWAHVK